MIVKIVAALPTTDIRSKQQFESAFDALRSLPDDHFLNASKDDVLRDGALLLVEIWDYTCLDCQASIPHIAKWRAKFAGPPFAIAAVHCPEFSFGSPLGNVRRAVAHLGIEYPVVHDPEFRVWDSLQNRYWPSRYLIAPGGSVVYHHFGSGRYGCTESKINRLLKSHFGGEFNAEHLSGSGISAEAAPKEYSTICLGDKFSAPANAVGAESGNTAVYRPMPEPPQNSYALSGKWRRGQFSATHMGDEAEGALTMSFTGAGLYVILSSANERSKYRLEVTQDGRPIAAGECGADLISVGDSTFLEYDFPRLYRVIEGSEPKKRTIKLSSSAKFWRVYSYSF